MNLKQQWQRNIVQHRLRTEQQQQGSSQATHLDALQVSIAKAVLIIANLPRAKQSAGILTDVMLFDRHHLVTKGRHKTVIVTVDARHKDTTADSAADTLGN